MGETEGQQPDQLVWMDDKSRDRRDGKKTNVIKRYKKLEVVETHDRPRAESIRHINKEDKKEDYT